MIEKQVSFERQFRTLTAASLSAFTLFISFYSLYQLLLSLSAFILFKEKCSPQPIEMLQAQLPIVYIADTRK